jgi:hypothetical protein
MKRILVFSTIPSDLQKQLSIAKILKENGFEVSFYLDDVAHDLFESSQIIREAGFKSNEVKKRKKFTSIQKTHRQEISKKNIIKPIYFFKKLKDEIVKLQSYKNKLEKVIDSTSPDVIIYSTNSFGYNVPLYNKILKKRKIVTVCIPFAIGDEDSLIKYVVNRAKCHSDYLLNKYFMSLLSRWKIQNENKAFLVIPAEQIIAFKIFNLKVENPKSFYGAKVNYLLLENDYMYTHALKDGAQADEILTIGNPYDDIISNRYLNRESLYKQFCELNNCKNDYPLICIALPPFLSEEPDNLSSFSLETLLSIYIPSEALLRNVNIVVSLHPRIAKFIKPNLNNSNVILTTRPVDEYIPLCDLFITTFSSTIRTAVGLGVPVINYDLLNFNYNLFRELEDVYYVNTNSEYSSKLKQLVKELQEGRKEKARLISSNFDGKTAERLIAFFENL